MIGSVTHQATYYDGLVGRVGLEPTTKEEAKAHFGHFSGVHPTSRFE
jgi:hypothetical protein